MWTYSYLLICLDDVSSFPGKFSAVRPGRNLLSNSRTAGLGFPTRGWKGLVGWIPGGWCLGLLVSEAHESRHCHVPGTSSAPPGAWLSGGGWYIFIQSTSKIILNRGEKINLMHFVCFLRLLHFPVSALWKAKQSNNNEIFYPSSGFAGTANAETYQPTPWFLSYGLYLQHSVLEISLNFFSPFVCLLSVVLRESGHKW